MAVNIGASRAGAERAPLAEAGGAVRIQDIWKFGMPRN